MALTRYRFTERQSGEIRVALPTVDGAALTVDDLTAVTLTLYDCATYVPGSPTTGILNERDQQDIRGGSPAGGLNVVYEEGEAVWTIQPEDNVIVTSRRQVERHRALFVFTWADGAFPFEVEIEVVNLRTVS